MSAGLSLIHVGLAKASSTALQTHFFPHLGLPYEPHDNEDGAGNWYKAVRYAEHYEPRPRKRRLVASGENLCMPGNVSCETVARRLHDTFGDAVILMVVRDLQEHFISYYRQVLLNDIMQIRVKLQDPWAQAGLSAPQVLKVPSADEYFDAQMQTSRNSYFQHMNLDQVVADFRKQFRVVVVDYNMITENFDRFAEIVCAEVGIPKPDCGLPEVNASTVDLMISAVGDLPDHVIEISLRRRIIASYAWARLSADRMKFLDDFSQWKCSATFAEALR